MPYVMYQIPTMLILTVCYKHILIKQYRRQTMKIKYCEDTGRERRLLRGRLLYVWWSGKASQK